MAVGVREAARKLGISEEAAMKRSQREGWLSTPEARQSVRLAHEARGIVRSSSAQPSAAQAMAQELTSLNSKSRLAMARGLGKAAAHVEQMDGQEIVEDASNVKQTVQSLALVHGWQANQTVTKVAINLTGVAPELSGQPTTIEAEWEDSPNPEESAED